MGADWRLSLAVRAATLRIIDYREYDYTAEWRKREYFLLVGLSKQLNEELLTQKIQVNAAVIASPKFDLKEPQEFLDDFLELYKKLAASKLPWVFTKEEQTGKITDRDFVNSTDRLIARYKEVYGTK